ncbi:GumC family protein [Pontibacter lucknowensis]|uniref:non-specific protein-tyrosine kinase n=1 Tax=Pontibacter lucknowensis TaxID=1077936 RepID=A0A1N6Y752_9BACT|nr:polysaccharide biosynthesis tyrosine autokinase [Pontibacter lucknowensis]SIR10311.1 capsular exopolysaccharide family [Pontibacter lucknowensis]
MSDLEFNDSQNESIDLKGLVLKYLKYWYLFILGVIISFAVVHVYLRYTIPVYKIRASILIKDESVGEGPSTQALGELAFFRTTNSLSNELLILKSVGLMERVLTELDYQTSFYSVGRFKTTELYGKELPLKIIISNLDSATIGKSFIVHNKDGQFYDLYRGENKIGSHRYGEKLNMYGSSFTIIADTDVAANRRISVKFNDIRKLANHYSGKLNIKSINSASSVMEISMNDAVPAKGKDVINKLIEVYNREGIEDKNQVIANTIKFIDERLIYLTKELDAVEQDVEEYKRKNKPVAIPSYSGLYSGTVNEFSKQLISTEIELEVLKSIEKYISNEETKFEAVPTTLGVGDGTLSNLIGSFNQLQSQRQSMLRSVKPGSPLVQNAESQLESLRTNILETIKNLRENILLLRKNYQANIDRYENQLIELPSMERDLLKINRQQGIKEGLYLYLLRKREEAAISQAVTVSNSRVVDKASASGTPIEPQPSTLYLYALIAGLAIPFAGLFLKDMLNDTVQESRDVEKSTLTPILGEIAHNDTGNLLVVNQESRSTSAELFRLLRANFQFAAGGKENKVILITSSMSGEGKTFFSLNLAASLVMTGKKVIVLGFDLRKPKLTQGVNLPNNIGITNYLISDNVQIDDLIQFAPDLPELAIIGSGPIPPNPAELMLLPKIGVLIDELKAGFDYIIIDSSPIGQVADSLALAPYIDSSLYIVRYNYTSKKQLQIIDDLYRSRKLKHPMIVLNDAKKNNSYGYSYGYGYGYGNYYEEEKKSIGSRIRKLVK